ncbi:MAG: DNA primase [Anaerolineales bacterium]|nr:DNA primase [Anaerolineales bacterium]
MSVVDEIKDRVDIVDVISETVKLKKSGKNFTGFCPFHPNTRTPAFVVFPETGTWRCFGACSEGGDVFGFLMKKEGWDFPEALSYLANRTGVELRPRDQADKIQDEVNKRLRELMETALTFYHHNLRQSESGEPILEYLNGRGLSDEILEIFEIGYAPKSWDATRTFLSERGYSEKELLDAGMVTERDSGGFYDRFRHRIMIPIRDGRGRLAGFGARAVDKDDLPKFLNSPQTALFDKGRLLYGLDKARKAIRSEDQSIIVEGYMDVIALHQAGYENAVSPMGTALTEHQLRLLKRFSRNMILALDADLAGSAATLRGLTVARETLDREVDPVFDARGLLRHEGRLDADIRVVTLPDEMDPDEVVAEDPEAWEGLIKDAQPIVNYVLEVLSEGRNLEDPKVKAEIARQVLPLIEDVADSVEREAYRQQLARTLRIDERALMGFRPQPKRRRRAAQIPAPDLVNQRTVTVDVPVERFCLGLLLKDPELLYRIDRQFQALQMERLSEQDFTGTVHQVIFLAVQTSLTQDEEEPTFYWRKGMNDTIVEVADGMISELSNLAELTKIEFDRPRVLDEITARFLQLRKRSLEERLGKLYFLLQMTQDEVYLDDDVGVEPVVDYREEVQRHAIQKARLEQALAKRQGSILTTG